MEAILAGIIGAILGSVVGGYFALRAAQMQTQAVAQQTLGSTHERLYNANQTLLENLASNPSVRPYFAPPAVNSPAETDENYSLILLIAEMHANHIELAAIHLSELPPVVQDQWKNFIIDQYECSPTIQQYLDDFTDWYSDPLWNILADSPAYQNRQSRQLSSSNSSGVEST